MLHGRDSGTEDSVCRQVHGFGCVSLCACLYARVSWGNDSPYKCPGDGPPFSPAGRWGRAGQQTSHSQLKPSYRAETELCVLGKSPSVSVPWFPDTKREKRIRKS